MTEAVALQLAEDEQNPYLLGLFAPVRDEITAEDLEVIGEIPRDLYGVYLRNGPNRRYAARGRYHWFDGDGMVHAMAFENGRARYRNRYVRTKAFTREEAAGGALWTGVMENPAGNPVGTARGLPLKDTANTDLIHHDGKVLATWYLCGQPMALDPLSLETLGAETFLDTLRGDVMAHPKADERTGELMWFDYGAREPLLRYGVVGASGQGRARGGDRPARPAAAARHGDHRELVGPHGPAARAGPRGRAPGPSQDRVRPEHARPLRRAPPPGHRGAVVHGRALLHLPRRQRVGGRRRRS